MNKYVLDASALLALLNQEKGSDFVIKHLSDACISAVNFSEVLSKMLDYGMPLSEAQNILDNLNLEIIPFDYEHSVSCSALRPATKNLGLSLGDRACLSLAQHLKMPTLTADQAWQTLALPLKVVLIR